MPFLIRYPLVIRPRSVNNDIILNIDFPPTFLDFAGSRVPAEMQGRSFRRNLGGHTTVNCRTAIYYRYWMHNDPDTTSRRIMKSEPSSSN